MKNLLNIQQLAIICTIIFISLSLPSCTAITAMSDKTAAYEQLEGSVADEGFQAGIDNITQNQRGGRRIYEENNAVSLYLDKGLLEYYAGDYRASTASLSNAERLIEEAFTKSITETAASFILNDNTKEYAGEDFEDIYLSVFNALNYYNLGNTEGALVEVRKLTLPSGKLDMIERKYQALNEKAISAGELPADATIPQVENVIFTNSALARYLSVLFYLSEKNQDAARIEMEQLRAAYASQPTIYKTPLPSSVDNFTRTDNSTPRLDIICFAGMSPIKREKIDIVYFPFLSSEVLRNVNFKLPELVNRPDRIDRIEIVVNDQTFNLELLEDMGAVIRDTFKASYNSIVTKTYMRTLVKYLALDVANYAMRNDDNNEKTETMWETIRRNTVLTGGKALFDATEKADVRMARFLPNKAYVGSCFIAPGTYDITVNYYSNGVLTHSEVKENYTISQNNVNLLQLVNLGFSRGNRNRD